MSLALAPLRQTKTILLTTYRRDETPVATPVSIAFDDDRAFFRTWHKAHETKRLRNNPDVKAAPSTRKASRPAPGSMHTHGCSRVAKRSSRHRPWPGATACCRRWWCHSDTA